MIAQFTADLSHASILARGKLTFSSHFSTHIDAPRHMLENGKTLSDFPIDKFVGDAIVIDVRGQNEIHSDLRGVKANDIVFFFTGHTNKQHSKKFFEGNPIISKETAQRLIKKRVKIVGIDSFTPDNHPYEIHKLFFKRDMLIVENLVNLEKLNGKRFKCYIFPLKIKNGDGAPCRVIGVIK